MYSCKVTTDYTPQMSIMLAYKIQIMLQTSLQKNHSSDYTSPIIKLMYIVQSKPTVEPNRTLLSTGTNENAITATHGQTFQLALWNLQKSFWTFHIICSHGNPLRRPIPTRNKQLFTGLPTNWSHNNFLKIFGLFRVVTGAIAATGSEAFSSTSSSFLVFVAKAAGLT